MKRRYPRVQDFRCDDAAGFTLRLAQTEDGDIYARIIPNKDDLELEGQDYKAFKACHAASVRIRTPMIGGGAHAELWMALAKVFNQMEVRDANKA